MVGGKYERSRSTTDLVLGLPECSRIRSGRRCRNSFERECQFSKAYRVHRPSWNLKWAFQNQNNRGSAVEKCWIKSLHAGSRLRPFIWITMRRPLGPSMLRDHDPLFPKQFGNSISTIRLEFRPAKRWSMHCKQVAQLLNVLPEEIFFTSGATESNNWILRSLALQRHLFSSPTGTNPSWKLWSFRKTGFPLHLWSVEKRIGSLVWNGKDSEVLGWIRFFPVHDPRHFLDVGEQRTWQHSSHGGHCGKDQNLAPQAFLHTDATQAVGKLPLDLQKHPVDALSFLRTNFTDPQGVGVLFLRQNGTAAWPLFCWEEATNRSSIWHP